MKTREDILLEIEHIKMIMQADREAYRTHNDAEIYRTQQIRNEAIIEALAWTVGTTLIELYNN